MSFLWGFNLSCCPQSSFVLFCLNLFTFSPRENRYPIVSNLLEMIGTRVLIMLKFECSRLCLSANIGIMA